mgnify:CR=1 FL=1
MLVVDAMIRDLDAARAEEVSPQDSMVRVEMSAMRGNYRKRNK